MISLKNKNIFIAGGSGYLGSVLCEEILKLDGNLFLADQDIKTSELVIKKLQKKYPKSKIIFSHLDMIDPKSISKNIKLNVLVKEILSEKIGLCNQGQINRDVLVELDEIKQRISKLEQI